MPKFNVKEFREVEERTRERFGPDRLGIDFNTLMQALLASPAFAAQLANIQAGASGITESLNSSFASHGLNTTGIGNAASAIGGSAGAFGSAQARGQVAGQAFDAAQTNLLARLQQQANIFQGFQKLSAGEQALEFGKALGGGAAGGAAAQFGPQGAVTAPVQAAGAVQAPGFPQRPEQVQGGSFGVPIGQQRNRPGGVV